MIYIDPPYNTGNDFVYPDNYKDNLHNYLEITGQVDSEGNRISTNSDAGGQFHTKWLNMMYPRLRLARNLLSDDGVIFISIDDNEVHNLRKVCDEVFGEGNFVSLVPRIAKRTSNKGTYFRPTKDHILVYSKNISLLSEFGLPKIRNEEEYNFTEEDGRKYKKSGASLYQPSLDSRPNQRYYIEAPDGSLIIPPGNIFPQEKKDGAKIKPISNADKVWRWSVETYLKQKNLLIFTEGSSKNPLLDENGDQSKWNIYPKVYFDEDIEATLHPEDVIYDFPNSQATKEIIELGITFSFAKPTRLVGYLIKLINEKKGIILDFFSGSATTAHAVMKLNAEDGGNRKFIMIQLPEQTPEGSEARNAGYKTIADIGKERIRRAGDKIVSELKEKQTGQKTLTDNEETVNPDELDIGFKVFKLDSSNLKKWNPDYDNLKNTLESMITNIVDGRSEEDLLYEIMLKFGIDLTYPIETEHVEDKNVYNIGNGALFICLDKNITKEVATFIASKKDEINPEVTRVVFRDNGFASDADKTNIVHILKHAGIEEIMSV
jgi:adenine-specific DNA-methyltransferase